MRKGMGRPGEGACARFTQSAQWPFQCNPPGLELQLQSELHHARIVDGAVHQSKAALCVDVLHAAIRTIPRQPELGVIEQVEELGAELQTHALPEGKHEVLDGREICVHKTRS